MRALLIENRRRVSRVAQKKRERVFVFGALFFVMALFFFTLLAVLSHRTDFFVYNIEVQGNAFVSRSELIARTDLILHDSYISLFPKRNSLLLPEEEIKETLLKEFPPLDSVSVEQTSLSSITVMVHERDPFLLWCSATTESEEVFSECFFVDKEGFVFGKAPDISSDIYVRFVGVFSSVDVIGTTVFTPERFREFSFFLQSLRELGLSPKTVFVEEGAAGIPDYSIELFTGIRLLISGAHSLEQTLADIGAFFGDPEVSASSTKFLEEVSYVDFRFENKVYYKMRP